VPIMGDGEKIELTPFLDPILWEVEMLKFEQDAGLTANIKVIGIGGGGGNAVNRMVSSEIKGVEFIAANTDAQALRDSLAGYRLQLGAHLTKGLGVGGDPEKGRQAAEEDRDAIKESLEGADMVFITAGLGGGTGTGGSPVAAEIAKELGALTVGVVTKPFMFEGPIRFKQAEEGLKNMKKKVDTLIVIPNQRLFSIIDETTPALDAFKVADDVLRQAVQSISEIITSHGMINVDFADVKTIMLGAGEALMGMGWARGKDRAIKAAKASINCPLLEDVSIAGAKGILVNITGNKDITMFEIKEAMDLIHNASASGANVFFGQAFDESLKDVVKITVIATGFPPPRALLEEKLRQEEFAGDLWEYNKRELLKEPGYMKENLRVPAILRRKKEYR